MDNPKFSLEHEAKLPLSIYLFSVQDGQIFFEFPHQIKCVLAYEDTMAINQIYKEYPQNKQLKISLKAKFEVSRLLDVLEQPSAQEIPPQSIVQEVSLTPPATLAETKEQFIQGLMLVKNKYIKDKEDRKSVTRILASLLT